MKGLSKGRYDETFADEDAKHDKPWKYGVIYKIFS